MESDLIQKINECRAIIKSLATLDPDQRIEVINELKVELHEVSPMKAHPVDCVIWIPADQLKANDYNPNTVAAPEMKLLTHSICEDGYTQPIVSFLESSTSRTVVDGFHRNKVGRENKRVAESTLGRLPVTTIKSSREDRNDRIASTIRHNRARGKHGIDAMSEIVVELSKRNWSNKKIGKELGMDPDEVLRLKQISGLAELFKDEDFSEAWEVDRDGDA